MGGLIGRKLYVLALLWSIIIGSFFVVAVPFTEIERVLYYDKTEYSHEINAVVNSYLESLGIDKHAHLAEKNFSAQELITEDLEYKWIQFENRYYIPIEGPLVDPVTFEGLNEVLKPLGAEVLTYEEDYHSETRILHMEIGFRETIDEQVIDPVVSLMTFSQHGVLPPHSITGNRGKVAIIVDDIGYKLEGVEAFVEMGRPLNFAVLPGITHSYNESKLASEAGHTVILHLPMEPVNPNVNPGLGSVWVGMSQEEVEEVIMDGLKKVPYATGVNNHMGSRVTADEEMMTKVLLVLEEKGLPFIDSRTTRDSVVIEVGKELGMDVLTNHFFLDNRNEVEYIKERIRILAMRALREGYAIGIMHDKPDRPAAIKSILPELESAGIDLVYLGELIGSEE